MTKLYALRLLEFASWGCNSCVPDEYIEKKKRSVLIDILHLLIRFSMIIDISHLAIFCDFLLTREKKVFFFMS